MIRGDDAARFRASTEVDPGSGCWNWSGYLSPDGYGRFWWAPAQRSITVQRASHLIFKGPIPDGYHVDHLCRNRRCGNPDHLEAVTSVENRQRGIASRTTCKRDHPYSEANTRIRIRADGTVVRTCLACARIANRKHYRKKAA